MSKFSGGCLCGAVRYDSSAEAPAMVAACHCGDCQKQSGTAFSMNVGVPTDSLTVSGESIKSFEVAGTSGLPVERFFCGSCGSPLYTDVKAFEGLLFIKAGGLDDASWVEPGVEIWAESKQPWATLSADLASVPANPPAG